MTGADVGDCTGASPADPTQRARRQLQNTAKQLEGVFVLQMLKAMRATVPKGGITEASNGEETFTSMLDEKDRRQDSRAVEARPHRRPHETARTRDERTRSHATLNAQSGAIK